MTKCKYCNSGYVDIDPPSSHHYRCPNCNGTGYIPEEGIDYWICPNCGEEVDYPLGENEVCNNCKEEIEVE